METTTAREETLWRNPNFLKLWTSETISQFGSQFTGLALPLTAIIILSANSTELGILVFAGSIPWLVFGLLVGGVGGPPRQEAHHGHLQHSQRINTRTDSDSRRRGNHNKAWNPLSLRGKLLCRIPT